MRKSRFSEEQIAYALRQVEQGTPATELCRKLGISEQTFYTWKKRFAGMRVSELKQVKVSISELLAADEEGGIFRSRSSAR